MKQYTSMNFKIVDSYGDISAKAVTFASANQIRDALSRKWGEQYFVETYRDPVPELLDALEHIEKYGYEMPEHEMVRKAISKAKGE